VVQAEASDDTIKGFLGLLLVMTAFDLCRKLLRKRGIRAPAALSTSRASS
jgi:hypothetical protein